MKYWVYILLCDNGAYYTGYTNDLERRYQEHYHGRYCKFTRSFKPIKIEQSWEIAEDKSKAMRIEKYIKTLTKAKKMQLIRQPEQLFELFPNL